MGACDEPWVRKYKKIHHVASRMVDPVQTTRLDLSRGQPMRLASGDKSFLSFAQSSWIAPAEETPTLTIGRLIPTCRQGWIDRRDKGHARFFSISKQVGTGRFA